jgi:RNA polymerase sigma-70 factor, ECF subfamily
MVVRAFDLNAEENLRPGSTPSGLLSRAKRFDPEAWQDLVGRYSWLTIHWCLQAGLSSDDAPDVLQTVLLRIAQRLGNSRKDGRTAAFRRWLRALTRSQVAEFRRNAARQPRGDGGSTAQRRFSTLTDKSAAVESAQQLDLLLERFWRLVDRLEESFRSPTWQAFWLTTVENLTSAEAAQVLKTTPAAVRLSKARILRRIGEEDANLLGGELVQAATRIQDELDVPLPQWSLSRMGVPVGRNPKRAEPAKEGVRTNFVGKR